MFVGSQTLLHDDGDVNHRTWETNNRLNNVKHTFKNKSSDEMRCQCQIHVSLKWFDVAEN